MEPPNHPEELTAKPSEPMCSRIMIDILDLSLIEKESGKEKDVAPSTTVGSASTHVNLLSVMHLPI
jgi:hypothetical protein